MKAVEDGWNAFTRSPWPFVLFVLLTRVLSVVFQIIGNVATATSRHVGPGVIVGTIVTCGQHDRQPLGREWADPRAQARRRETQHRRPRPPGRWSRRAPVRDFVVLALISGSSW